MTETATEKEFWPIEFFLRDKLQEIPLITWIVDQVGALRSVFNINKWQLNTDSNEKTTLVQGKAVINLKYGKDKFFITTKKTLGMELLRDTDHRIKAVCVHLTDGTAMLFIRMGKTLQSFHFCFEESDDWDILANSTPDGDSALSGDANSE